MSLEKRDCRSVADGQPLNKLLIKKDRWGRSTPGYHGCEVREKIPNPYVFARSFTIN